MIQFHGISRFVIFTAVLLAASIVFSGKEVEMLHEGQPFVDFRLEAHDGSSVGMTDLEGRPFLLFYYPKADTPG